MKQEPLVILGGGLAGLSAGYHSQGVVFEKDQQVGGQAKSKNINGFVLDEGIHVLHTKNEYVLKLLEQNNANLIKHQREAWIYSFGALTRYPFQANTYGLPVSVVKDCLVGFIQNDFNDQDKIKNYEDWIYYMFGKGIAEHFMLQYSQKFWGVPPAELNTEWVGVRHPRPSVEEIIAGALSDQSKGFGVNAEFLYPEQRGYGAIAEAMAESIKDRLRLGKGVTKIDLQKKEIEFNNQENITYERVVSSLPLPEEIKLLTDVPPEVREATDKLRTNSILVVNLGINRPNISDKHWIYYHEPDYSFFRISFPGNYGAQMVPSGTSSVAVEISYRGEPPLEGLTDRVVADLKKAKILKEDDRVLFTDIVDIKYGYVIYDQHRTEAVEIIHNYLKQYNFYPCGRYGEWAYFWSDDAILSGKKAAEEL